jgi:parallel beta-helix repeat protein
MEASLNRRPTLSRWWPRVLAVGAAIAVLAIGTPQASASSSTWFISSDTTLTADFNGQIVVVGSGVTLNCAGHLVSGEGSGVGVNVVANGVSVTNCRVQAFDTGILTNSDATHILSNRVGHNGEGIRLSGATNAAVSKNRATQNQFWGIIAAEGTSGAAITANSANNNGMIGIALNTATGNRVSDNSANHNGDTGLDSLLSSGNQILNNAAMHNGNQGFGFESASNNTVTENSATNNGTRGNGCGFCFNDSSSNSVAHNQAFRNGGFGFYAFFGSQFNVFSGNRGCQNFFVDALDASTGAGNTWINNRFCTTEGIS